MAIHVLGYAPSRDGKEWTVELYDDSRNELQVKKCARVVEPNLKAR